MKDSQLTEYVKRSKYHRDIVKSQIGTKILHSYVKNTSKYIEENDVDKQADMLSNSFEHFSTYVMMCGCDHSKYGTLMKGFVSQYSKKNNQYPKSMTDATDVMSLHPFNQAYYDC